MSRETAATIRDILRALSPLRIAIVFLREIFAETGPGRKIARDVLAVGCYIASLPTLAPHPESLSYATILVYGVLGSGQIGQVMVDRLKPMAKASPGEEPGLPGPRPPPAGGAS